MQKQPPQPDPIAVRTLAQMLDSERARADAAEWIKPKDWPDEGARRCAAAILQGGKLKPASPEVDALEVAYWTAIARCRVDDDGISRLLAERERVYVYACELSALAGRLKSGKVGTFTQALEETRDVARAVRELELASTARLTADDPAGSRRRPDPGSRGWSRSAKTTEVAAA